MNKKGFTLVEIIVTLALLAVVLIFMMNALIKLKKQEENATFDKNLLVHQSIISRNINKDVLAHGGIVSFENCSSNSCTIVYSDDERRTLLISDDLRTLSYKNGTTDIFIRTLDEEYSFISIINDTNVETNGILNQIIINFGNVTMLQSTTSTIGALESTIYYEGYNSGSANNYKVEIYSYLVN